MNLLITGANGFIGRNLINTISLKKNYKIFYVSRYNSSIFPFVPKKIDFVIHLASVHRLEPASLIYSENEKINKHLIEILNNHHLKSNILFTSSIHENADTFYAKSKKNSSVYLKNICKSWNTDFAKLIFPNIFGPFAKPYHTSVVANFCSDIINDKQSKINNVDLGLLYVDEAVKAILQFKSKSTFSTESINLVQLHQRIKNLYDSFSKNNTLVLNDSLDIKLFNTLKSYIY